MNIDCTYTVSVPDGWSAEALHDALCNANRIVLIAHKNADGDAVGSLTGMYALLRLNTDAEVTPLLPDGCPEDLTWLPNTQYIIDCGRDKQKALEAVNKAELIIALDLNNVERTGNMAEAISQTKALKVMIDHHIDPQREMFDIVVSDDTISSACEMVYWTMRKVFGKKAFNKDAATSLYCGICTDTGTFSYSNTRESIYLASAELLSFGIDPMAINHNIKNVFTTHRLKFFGFAFNERLTVYKDEKVALMVLSYNDINSRGVVSSDLTGLVNEVMKLRDIDCAVLIREESESVRLSFRSKELFNVNLIAKELFDGGGHEHAAGATSYLTLTETVAKVKRYFSVE